MASTDHLAWLLLLVRDAIDVEGRVVGVGLANPAVSGMGLSVFNF